MMKNLLVYLSTLDPNMFADYSMFQIGCFLQVLLMGFFILLLFIPVVLSKGIRDKSINYTLYSLMIISSIICYFGFTKSFDEKQALILSGVLFISSLLFLSLTYAPVGSKWWIYPFLPVFEIIFVVISVSLIFNTIATSYFFFMPELSIKYPALQEDDIFHLLDGYKIWVYEAEALLITFAIFVHVVRRQIIFLASPENQISKIIITNPQIPQKINV